MDNRPKGRRTNPNIIRGSLPRWLICCEGKSEAVYLMEVIEAIAKGREHGIFIGIKGKCDKRRIQGECGKQHTRLIQQAQLCSKCAQFEQVWVVFDMDATGEDSDTQTKNFKEAIEYSKHNTYIKVAWNIPCFEYWIALHGSDYIDSGDANTLCNRVHRDFANKVAEKSVYCNKKYRNLPFEKHCSKESPLICMKSCDKPYYNVLQMVGGLKSVEAASKRSKACYDKNNVNGQIDRNAFNDISCCSTMYNLIEAIKKYFDDNYKEDAKVK